MTLRHLRIFVAVCRTGSTTGAGQALYMAQPSVSLAIAELESHYGIKLFDRISRRLHLTGAGRQMLEYAENILALYDEMESRVQSFEDVDALRLGASITIANRFLPGLLLQLAQQFPGVQVHTVVENSGAVEQQLLDNQLDMGLVEGAAHAQSLVARDFMEDELVLVCPAQHPWAGQSQVPLAQLESQPFLLRERGSGGRELFESVLAARGVKLSPVWESASTGALLRAVAAGLGVSVLPHILARPAQQQGEVHCLRIKGVPLLHKFCIVYHKNKYLTRAAGALVEMCLALDK